MKDGIGGQNFRVSTCSYFGNFDDKYRNCLGIGPVRYSCFKPQFRIFPFPLPGQIQYTTHPKEIRKVKVICFTFTFKQKLVLQKTLNRGEQRMPTLVS